MQTRTELSPGIILLAHTTALLVGACGFVGEPVLQGMLAALTLAAWAGYAFRRNPNAASHQVSRVLRWSVPVFLLVIVLMLPAQNLASPETAGGAVVFAGLLYIHFRKEPFVQALSNLLVFAPPALASSLLGAPAWSIGLATILFIRVAVANKPKARYLAHVAIALALASRLPVQNPWSLLLFVAWIVVILRKHSTRELVLAITGALLCLVIDMRGLSPSLFKAGDTQVVRMLDLETSAPSNRMETTCVNDFYVTTPHQGARGISVSYQNQTDSRWQHLVVAEEDGELPDHSLPLTNGILYVDSASKSLRQLDIHSGTISDVARTVTPTNVFHMHWGFEHNSILLTHDLAQYCTEVFLPGGSMQQHAYHASANGIGSECSSLPDGRLVLSYQQGLWSKTIEIRSPQGAPMHSTQIKDLSPYHQHGYWSRQNLLLVPQFITGTILGLDPASLQVQNSFDAEPGVRGVLDGAQCDRPDTFFSWSYLSGTIHEFRNLESRPTRSWKTGPILRTLNWDCDCGGLLAATATGIYRIRFQDNELRSNQ